MAGATEVEVVPIIHDVINLAAAAAAAAVVIHRDKSNVVDLVHTTNYR